MTENEKNAVGRGRFDAKLYEERFGRRLSAAEQAAFERAAREGYLVGFTPDGVPVNYWDGGRSMGYEWKHVDGTWHQHGRLVTYWRRAVRIVRRLLGREYRICSGHLEGYQCHCFEMQGQRAAAERAS